MEQWWNRPYLPAELPSHHHTRQHCWAAVFSLFPALTHVTDDMHACDEVSGCTRGSRHAPRVARSSDMPLSTRDSPSAPVLPFRDGHLNASQGSDVILGITWTPSSFVQNPINYSPTGEL